jgi:hypothetical protein
MIDKVKWLGKVYSYGIEETERFLFHDILCVWNDDIESCVGEVQRWREKLSLANIH